MCAIRSPTMRKRSEAAKPSATKPTAIERTPELPIAPAPKKPDLVSHDGKVNCPTCEAIVMLGKCTKRENGTFECSECGGVIDDVAITSSTTASERAHNNAKAAERVAERAARDLIDASTASASNVDVEDGPPEMREGDAEVERMSPPVAMSLQEQADADQVAHHEAHGICEPKNGGLAGYCGECGAAWPYLNGELLKSCGHVAAERVEHPTEAKKIRPPAGQQVQSASSPRARPLAVTTVHNAASAAPTPTNRISIPWGEARCPVDQWNNFKCGGFIVTVDLAPGENRVEAAKAILADLEQIADLAFQRQHAWYLKKLNKLGVPDY